MEHFTFFDWFALVVLAYFVGLAVIAWQDGPDRGLSRRRRKGPLMVRPDRPMRRARKHGNKPGLRAWLMHNERAKQGRPPSVGCRPWFLRKQAD